MCTLCACVHVCIYGDSYMCIMCMNVSRCGRIYMYFYAHVCIYVCMYVCGYMCMHVYVFELC